MPLYEYECQKCGHRFEKIQKFSDPLVKTCPECGGKVKKLLSAPAIRFKGTGWYVTDYAHKSSSGSEEKKGASSSKETSASGKDKKPAASKKKDSGD